MSTPPLLGCAWYPYVAYPAARSTCLLAATLTNRSTTAGHNACVQETFLLLKNGAKAQEQWDWCFYYCMLLQLFCYMVSYCCSSLIDVFYTSNFIRDKYAQDQAVHTGSGTTCDFIHQES